MCILRMLQPGYVPKDAYDMTALVKTIGICTNSDGIVIPDPTRTSVSFLAYVFIHSLVA